MRTHLASRAGRAGGRPRTAPAPVCLLALLALAAGCVTGDSLRALNPDEAKIDLYPDGHLFVRGEPVAWGDLADVIRDSSTRPEDTILVRYHGDVDEPGFATLRNLLTDQMFQAEHLKFRIFTTPQASVSTYDPRTGKTETFVDGAEVRRYSGAELREAAEAAAAEKAAIADGTYVSPAVRYKPVAVANRDTGLSINPQTVRDAAPAAKPAKPAKPTAARQADGGEESLRARYLRQQRQLRGGR